MPVTIYVLWTQRRTGHRMCWPQGIYLQDTGCSDGDQLGWGWGGYCRGSGLGRSLKNRNLTWNLKQPCGNCHFHSNSTVWILSPCKWRLLLQLLLSRFSRVRLCATPQMAAHQAPPSLGFSRQEHWSGLPFPSPMHESEKWKWSYSVMSDSY